MEAENPPANIINFQERVRQRLLRMHPERENNVIDFRPWSPPEGTRPNIGRIIKPAIMFEGEKRLPPDEPV